MHACARVKCVREYTCHVCVCVKMNEWDNAKEGNDRKEKRGKCVHEQ